MRTEAEAHSISWIPSEAIRGLTRLPFDFGITHYDEPPPGQVKPDELDGLLAGDRFRFANHLTAWIEVEDGRITGHGQGGRALINNTKAKVPGSKLEFVGVAYPTLTPAPEVGDGFVRFFQTAGGRPGVPSPRRVNRRPFLQLVGPTVWTTIAITLHADGRIERELAGATRFPRHWLYAEDGELVSKSGVIDFRHWYRNNFGEHSPWGDEDAPAITAAVETALERELSAHVMRSGTKPTFKKVRRGGVLFRQGKKGDDLAVILDGMVSVEVDGATVAELGPGAVIGERAILEDGVRTATIKALTAVRVAIAPPGTVDLDALDTLRDGHRREELTTR